MHKTTSAVPGRTIRLPLCNSDKLMYFVASLQVADPENIVRMAAKGRLPLFCRDISKHLDEAHGYLKTCYVPPSQRLYSNLILGIDSLYRALCLDLVYQQAFEKHSNCFQKLYHEFDNCDGPRDWAEDTNKTRLCKAYKNIVDCYMIKTALICGPDAADVFKKLLLKVLRATVLTDCGISSYLSTEKSKHGGPIMTQKSFNIAYLSIIFILILMLLIIYLRR